MEYLTLLEEIKKWDISSRQVTLLCNEGRGSKKGLMWLFRKKTKKPKAFIRMNNNRKKKIE